MLGVPGVPKTGKSGEFFFQFTRCWVLGVLKTGKFGKLNFFHYSRGVTPRELGVRAQLLCSEKHSTT